MENNNIDERIERVNIRISGKIKDWYMDLSKQTGISMSALMAMALSEYRDQKSSLEAMSTLQKMYIELSSLDMPSEDKKIMLSNIVKEM